MTENDQDEHPDEAQAEAARRRQIHEALVRLLRLLAEGIADDLLGREAQEQGHPTGCEGRAE